MSVKFFDAPISDIELANLAEVSADSLDAPTTEFKRQAVPTAPMPFRPGQVEAGTQATTSADRTALTQRVERPRGKRRTGQWLLAAAIVIGLGFTGHFVGAHVNAAHASDQTYTAVTQPVAQPVVASQPEMVAAPVVRITTKAPDVVAEAAPVAKPKVHHRREAPVDTDQAPTNAETKSETVKSDKPTAKTDTKAATEEPPKPAETADSELMRQAAETLSNAQLDNATP
jgi:hypothetical protein